MARRTLTAAIRQPALCPGSCVRRRAGGRTWRDPHCGQPGDRQVRPGSVVDGVSGGRQRHRSRGIRVDLNETGGTLMTRWMRLVAAVMLATAGASCGAELAVVPVTKPKDPTKPTEEGVFYALPRTVAKV